LNLQTGVVCADAQRSIERHDLWPKRPFPDDLVVREYFHLVCVDFGSKIVGVSGVQNRNGRAASRLDVAVSAITAFGAGVLAGIALHRNDEFGFGFDAPHGIDEVAGVLGAKFQTELAAEFTGA